MGKRHFDCPVNPYWSFFLNSWFLAVHCLQPWRFSWCLDELRALLSWCGQEPHFASFWVTVEHAWFGIRLIRILAFSLHQMVTFPLKKILVQFEFHPSCIISNKENALQKGVSCSNHWVISPKTLPSFVWNCSLSHMDVSHSLHAQDRFVSYSCYFSLLYKLQQPTTEIINIENKKESQLQPFLIVYHPSPKRQIIFFKY